MYYLGKEESDCSGFLHVDLKICEDRMDTNKHRMDTNKHRPDKGISLDWFESSDFHFDYLILNMFEIFKWRSQRHTQIQPGVLGKV